MDTEDKKNFINTIVITLIALSQGLLCIADLSLSYMYKDDFHLSPAKVAIFNSLMTVPWIVKPLWGFISDCYPIMGKRRSPYLMIFGIIGATCWGILGASKLALIPTLLILSLIQVSVCFCNVIGEALVVEESQKHLHTQENASKYVSIFFGARAIGTVLTAYCGGLLLEVVPKQVVFIITAFCPILLMCTSFILQEETIKTDIKVTDQAELIYRFIRRKEIFMPIVFIFMFTAVPACSDAMFFFYTNQLGFKPEFMGKMKLAYGIGQVAGMTIYINFLKNVEFKKLLVVNTFICIGISLSQLLIVTRVNEKIGIPDEIFAVFCSFIVQLIGELNMIPLLILCCKICPKNIEGSLYALLMSTINFGALVSNQSGGILMILLGITQTQFSNLWAMILITCLAMIIPLPILYWVEDTKHPNSKEAYELV